MHQKPDRSAYGFCRIDGRVSNVLDSETSCAEGVTVGLSFRFEHLGSRLNLFIRTGVLTLQKGLIPSSIVGQVVRTVPSCLSGD
jgi:hypothetical protein